MTHQCRHAEAAHLNGACVMCQCRTNQYVVQVGGYRVTLLREATRVPQSVGAWKQTAA